MIEIRPATLGDLDGIMAVETETFGPVGKGAAASRETMAHRIRLLNQETPEWFFVACHHGRVLGDIVLQPTNLSPESCTSWGAATNGGSLDGTFSRDGKNIYGVSLAASRDAPPATPELLLHQGFLTWHSTGKDLLLFCSRLPGFASAHRRTGISAEDYLAKRRTNGGPRDPLLYLYWKWTGGAEPVRLLRNGYALDSDSGGYGALYALDDPVAALRALTLQLPGTGAIPGQTHLQNHSATPKDKR
jgi:hypothetical protein